MVTGQWFVDARGVRWFFDSGALSLDFGYTGDFGFDNPRWERLHAPGDLVGWLRERFGPSVPVADRRLFADALGLRAAIVGLVRARAGLEEARAADIDVINRWAARPDLAPRLPGGTEEPALPSVPRALATIARDAVRVLDGEGRIRSCAGGHCALIFYDGSRANTRQWCSMRRCGNRAKVRRHRARHVPTQEATP